MVSLGQKELFETLMKLECCKRCALRYLGVDRSLITFEHPDTSLENFELIPFGPASKKLKNNPCSVCLGLLDDSICEQMLAHEDLSEIRGLRHKSFMPQITFPTCIYVRDHSMRVFLKKQFPGTFKDDEVIKIKHAWRLAIEGRLCLKLKKIVDVKSKLTIHFITEYLLEDEEMQVFYKYFNKRRSKNNPTSRHFTHDILQVISDDTFEKVIKVPPKSPLYEVQSSQLKYGLESIYLIGQYCKYSRTLQQTSFVHNMEKENPYNIESIIASACNRILGDCKISFKASSFDEPSVRVLGQGRSFHIQIFEPKFEKVSKYQCEMIQREINKDSNLRVSNLREEHKKEIMDIFKAESRNPITLKVLCFVYECENIDNCINAVNMYSSFWVNQKTPCRLLARITDARKIRRVFHIKATRVEDFPNFIELDLCCDSGLHVEEFVNGDFGRTRPSLRDMMKAKVEILAVDVVEFGSTLSCALEEQELDLLM